MPKMPIANASRNTKPSAMHEWPRRKPSKQCKISTSTMTGLSRRPSAPRDLDRDTPPVAATMPAAEEVMTTTSFRLRRKRIPPMFLHQALFAVTPNRTWP